MEIRHLKLIKAVVEEGGITNATEILHLTQSAISHQLKEAESQLGTPVFYRINKKLVLTPAGEKMLEASKLILSELKKVRSEVKALTTGELGSLSISPECYTCYHWLPPLLKRFNLDFPNIEVNVMFEFTKDPIEQLITGKLDLAITSHPMENDKIEYIELFCDELLAVVGENHPWNDLDFVTAEDFIDTNLIIHSLPIESVTVFQKVLSKAGILPKKITPIPLTEATIEMIKAEMGISVMPKWTLKPYLAQSAINTIKVTPEGLHRNWYVARLKDRNFPSYFDCFISFLRQEIQF
ncbi:MAG: LysR family transcriptional regulator [Flammeovirgaceae bacterium]|nr:LysR family transcriptional regulator [Flammeovirgaceae bacterium]